MIKATVKTFIFIPSSRVNHFQDPAPRNPVGAFVKKKEASQKANPCCTVHSALNSGLSSEQEARLGIIKSRLPAEGKKEKKKKIKKRSKLYHPT